MKATRQQNSTRKANIIYFVLFMCALVLTVWGINIYRLTFIDTSFLIIYCSGGGLISVFLMRFLPKPSYSFVWIILIRLSTGIGFLYSALLILNQHYGEPSTVEINLTVHKKGFLPKGRSVSCNQPYVVVDYKEIRKDLIFSCEFAEDVEAAQTVKLVLSKGFLGFDVIKSKELITD